MKVEFKFDRATKNTFRFQEVAEPDSEVIGSLYVKKDVFEGKQPTSVTLEVSWK